MSDELTPELALFDGQAFSTTVYGPPDSPDQPCRDCRRPTTKYPMEAFMVCSDVWTEAGMSGGFLCVGCIEQRLGRTLNPDDFLDCGFNEPNLLDSERLASRKGTTALPDEALATRLRRRPVWRG